MGNQQRRNFFDISLAIIVALLGARLMGGSVWIAIIIAVAISTVIPLRLCYSTTRGADPRCVAYFATGLHENEATMRLFRPKNFVDKRIEYQQIVPALQLASRPLALDETAAHWWTLFYGKPEPQWSLHDWVCIAFPGIFLAKSALRLHFPDPPNIRLADQKQSVLEAFSLLADNVTFGLDKQGVSRGGCCEDGRFGSANLPFSGLKSKIYISPSHYNRLVETATKPADREEHLWLQVQLAVLLVHELAHAALNLARKRNSCTFFLPSCCTSEEGCEIEVATFGGRPGFAWTLSEDGTSWDTVRLLHQWPDPSTIKWYSEEGQAGFECRAPVSETGRGWELSDSWIEALFSEAFWDDVNLRGVQQLRPPRGASYVSSKDGKGFEREKHVWCVE